MLGRYESLNRNSVVSNEEWFPFLKIWKSKIMASKFHLLKIRYITCAVSRAGNYTELASVKSKPMKIKQKDMFVHYIAL